MATGEKRGRVSSFEVVELLRKVGDGEIVPVLDRNSKVISSSGFDYLVVGWRVGLYWDAGVLD